MSGIIEAKTGQDRAASKLEQVRDRINDATVQLNDLASECCHVADEVSGSEPSVDKAEQPREVRPGQIGTLEDVADILHDRVDELQKQFERLRQGLEL